MNEQVNKSRFTMVAMTVETYGTELQRQDTMQRLQEELELQGFRITFFTEIKSGES